MSSDRIFANQDEQLLWAAGHQQGSHGEEPCSETSSGSWDSMPTVDPGPICYSPEQPQSPVIFDVTEEVIESEKALQSNHFDKTREILMRHKDGHFIRYICFCKFHLLSEPCKLRRDARIFKQVDE